MKERLQRKEIPEAPLFVETRYTDGSVVNIIQMSPVKEDGSPDTDRKPEFRGETMANIGLPQPINITFRIPEAETLEQARNVYGKHLDIAAQEQLKLIQMQLIEMQKAKQQQIVVPGQMPQGMPPGMMSPIVQKKG